MNGKGSRPRPYDRERYEQGYERIFGEACVNCGVALEPTRGGDCKARCPNCGHMYPHGDCSD